MMTVGKIRRALSAIFIYRNPFRYLQAKLSRDRNKVGMIHLWNRARFKIHMGNSDINSVSEVFGTDAYRGFFSKIRRGDVLVDVGANIGVVSVAAGLRGANVIAFEPNPYITGLLRENLSLNHVSATVHEEGLAGQPGKRQLAFVPTMWGGASLYGEDAENAKYIYIDCVGINNFLDGLPGVDFMKIDIEGAEEEVLGAISSENAKKIKNIFVEYHPPFASAESVSNKLQEHGFKVRFSSELCTVVGERLR